MFQREQPDDGPEGGAYHLMYIGRSSLQIERDFGDRLEELSNTGFEVHVLAGPDGGFDGLAERGVHCRSIPVLRRENVAGLIGAYFIVQAYLIEHEPILVHGYDGMVAWMAAVAADRVGTPAVFATVEGHATSGRRRPSWEVGPVDIRLAFPGLVEALESRLDAPLTSAVEVGARAMYRGIAERVDRYLVTTEREFDMLEQSDWMPGHKLEIVIGGRGIDVDRFNPEGDDVPSVEEARRQVGIPDDWRHVVGYAGPLQPDRGGLDLLRVIDRGSAYGDVGWLVAPTGEVADSYLARLKGRMGSGEAIVIADEVDEVAVYRSMDLLAHPRAERSVSTGLMKGQAMRVPALAYDTAASAAVIANGQTGRLVVPGEVEEFARVLRGLLDDPKRVRDFGRRGRSRALNRFDREHVDGQVLRLYDTLLEQRLET